MNFQDILEKYRKEAYSERDKGARFERLMQGFLLTDPRYAYKFKHVWMWEDFPGRKDLGGSDTGIDLVAQTNEGDYWAIQCKCYKESTVIDKGAVDSFLSTSSRKFLDDQFRSTGFSERLWISTSNKWGPNATEALKNQNPPVTRLNLVELLEAKVDWEKIEQGIHGKAARAPKKPIFDHVWEVQRLTNSYFQENERGKLIMACGTGKTIASLKIAEKETDGKGLILFLVPSIALLGQTLREWTNQADEPINAVCICSDPEISRDKKAKDDSDSFSIVDLALPASTDPKEILKQFQGIKTNGTPGMTVVFGTYQSIDVIARAQQEILKEGFPVFDLIICDEAHRTTGAKLNNEDESAFTKVHNANYIKAKKRLYMTATPRLFGEDAKSKAAQFDVELCSMDDETKYGHEIHRIGFGEAVGRGLLTDYKVMVLTLSDKNIPPQLQRVIAGKEKEIKTDDITKLVGSINALSKKFLAGDQDVSESDPGMMRRAVAFCSSIDVSKKISDIYNATSEHYVEALPPEEQDQMVKVQSKHMDGSMGAPMRDQMLSWLKEPTEDEECRVITNVKVLSEGVDVPSLDAVIFLAGRNSPVDVVQSVGRVMRKAPGKKYGYIIIPVVVPVDVEAEKALEDNERFKVVWTVLNALRAHDDRFNATINKIELNKSKPNQILVGTPGYSFGGDGEPINVSNPGNTSLANQLKMQFGELQNFVFAKLVRKVGDRRYWEQWAKDVAIIAERQMERIQYLVSTKSDQRNAFDKFLDGLKKNINPSIEEEKAVEMLAQHMITQPIFDALFEGYSFVKHNPVSTAMQSMIDALEEGSNLAEQDETLKKFYASVRERATGINNSEGKQRIIIELYDKFFKAAFPKMVEQLGIVYTPIEVVDFIIHSVNDVLKQEFGRSISDENIHVLDPFTGTGTFITRLLQSGLIEQKDLKRKYTQELHANEIVLLAYYIAAVNIENAYHDATPDPDDGIGKENYTPFEGIVLTDTFQLGETGAAERLFSEMFPQNSARVERQKQAPLRVIIGNPPYSVGQKSANDNAQNQKYARLDMRIADTYAKLTEATNKNSLYDSYIKAFRWSTDRLDPKHGGVIAFVSNGAWIDGNSADGFRKSLQTEFSSIWVFNLRGNARTQGELRQREAGNVFGGGSRTPIAITILVKNPAAVTKEATIHYRDIGDYLSQQEKLSIVAKFNTVANPEMLWQSLEPNAQGDWISQRNDLFGTFIPIDDEKSGSIWKPGLYCRGLETSRDAWLYNSSKSALKHNVTKSIDFYNKELDRYLTAKSTNSIDPKTFVNFDAKQISWSRAFLNDIKKRKRKGYDDNSLVESLYRPFFKQFLYFNREQNNVVSRMDSFFPTSYLDNLVICVSANYKDGSVLMTNEIPDLHFNGDTQCFPLHYYEEVQKKNLSLFDEPGGREFIRREAISDYILERAQKLYGKRVSNNDIFFYVYGFLHSPDYRRLFANDLKKLLPRLPLLDDVKAFWAFSNAGRRLGQLHMFYEMEAPYEGLDVIDDGKIYQLDAFEYYKVEKMRFPKKGQKDTIIYNSRLTITNIPAKAYDYVVNGKSAIEWIMERYQVTVHKESGIKNDPNDWSREQGNPSYIFDLLLSIINVSMQTVEIVEGLPKVKFE